MDEHKKKTTRNRGWRWLRRVGYFFGAVGLLVGALALDACAAVGKSARGPRLNRMRHSLQWERGQFVNTIPRVEPRIWGTMVEWIKAKHTVPKGPLPLIKRRAADYATPPASGLRVTWLGHSSMLIEIDGHRVLTDPIWSERASPFSWIGPRRFHPPPLPLKELPPIDAVLISHDHYDHLDRATIVALNKRGARFIVPLGVGAHLEYWGVPSERIEELDWWQEAKVGTLRVVATPARHFSGRSPVMADKDKTLWAGLAVIGPRHRVFYSGDTAMFPGFAEIGERLGPFDATMFDAGAYNQAWADVHLGPEQAVQAHLLVKGKLMIPAHWGTFDLSIHSWIEPMERLITATRSADVPVVTPIPGQRIEPASPPPVTRWWPTVPWNSAREAPVVSSGL